MCDGTGEIVDVGKRTHFLLSWIDAQRISPIQEFIVNNILQIVRQVEKSRRGREWS